MVGNCYSGHNFLTPREKFKPNLPLYKKHLIFFCGKIKINCLKLFWFFLTLLYYTFITLSELSNFSKAFLLNFTNFAD